MASDQELPAVSIAAKSRTSGCVSPSDSRRFASCVRPWFGRFTLKELRISPWAIVSRT